MVFVADKQGIFNWNLAVCPKLCWWRVADSTRKPVRQWIYVIDKSDATAAKHRIRLGRQNPQMFEVLAVPEPGEQVVSSS